MPRKTYCPRLWEEIYIDEEGRIFACCHNKPAAFGTIYNEELRDIYNNAIARKFRNQSLSGALRCFRSCKLLSMEERDREPDRSLSDSAEYSDLKRLKILFGEACNIECIMCWQDSSSRTFLNCEKLIRNVDITPFEGIELQGGEPLFIEGAKRYFEFAASEGKRISFLTNGTIMTDEWAEKIAKHSSFIYFSLNAATREMHELINKGSSWERVLRNIQKVREARDRYHTDLKILGHMTIITKNLREIPLFIENFREFGVDAIDFGFDLRVPFYLKLHPVFKRRLGLETAVALRECDDPSLVDTNRLEMLGLD